MDDDTLISIIVPVYNVESYLERCVNSILQQKYTNLEIILVDDGSTDKSGIICDEFERKDTRIKVIHKSNGGLSSARNVGLDIATGKYIGFVDSDDYIDADMYYQLYTLCSQYNLDLVAARFTENIEGVDISTPTSGEFGVFDGKQLLEINLFGHEKYEVTNSVWDRLYRREVIDNLRFPEGKKYEDICFSTLVFLKSKRCGYLDKILYHYTIRNDSIMGQGIKKVHDVSEDFFEDLIPQLREQADILDKYNLNILADRVRYEIFSELCRKLYQIWNIRSQKKIKKKIIDELNKDRNWLSKYVIANKSKKEICVTLCFCYFRPALYFRWMLNRKFGRNA